MLPSHTGTQQWQSFELKMRRRRVERCLLRASVAIEAEVWEDAREALEEVGRLEPGEPELARLSAALTIAESAPPEVVDTPASRRGSWLAVAALLVFLSGAGGWLFATSWMARSAAPRTPSGAVTPSPAPPASQVEVPEPAEPSVQISEMAISVPVTAGDAPDTPVATDGDTAAVSRPAGGNGLSATEMTGADALDRRGAVAVPADERISPRAGTERESPVTRALDPGVEPVLNLPEPSVAPAGATAAAPLAVAPAPTALPPSIPASPPPAPPARTSAEPDENGVRAALTRYESAYNRLDAAAARAVWPTVDQRGLARAFEGLDAQVVSLGRCEIRVTAPSAQASCVGSAKWTPKVGGGAQTAPRQWRFSLQDTGSDWIITQANVR